MAKKKYKKVDLRSSMLIRVLHQEAGIGGKELCKRFPQFSERSAFRHAAVKHAPVPDGRKANSGRPRKLKERDERNIVRTLKRLRCERASFSAKKIQEETKLEHVSTKSVCRVLRKHDYRWKQSRKKGLLTSNDKKKRLKFARETVKFEKNFWQQDISFYFDGVGFAHKTHPYNEARAVANMCWRKHGEGLEMTTKGKKEGSNGKMANFFVAIAYGKGVVLAKQYPWVVTGEKFAEFVKNVFPELFKTCGVEAKGAMFLQDGDPRQNSAAARHAWEKLGCKMFHIPPRSPDLNPIENIFHLVRKSLKEDALSLEIKDESYDEFSKRVANTLLNFPTEIVNKTIDAMGKRIAMVIKCKGGRSKY